MASNRSKNRSADADNPTPSWDRHRNATTVTLYFDGAETADEAAIIRQLEKEHPGSRGWEVDVIHSRKPASYDFRGASVCCLVSWINPTCKHCRAIETDGWREPLAFNQPSLPLEGVA